jgi:hypothetical protein
VCVIGGFGIGDWNMKFRVLFSEKTFEFIVPKIEGGGYVRRGFGKIREWKFWRLCFWKNMNMNINMTTIPFFSVFFNYN